MSVVKGIAILLIALVVCVGIILGLGFSGLILKEWFGTANQTVERKIFEKNKGYIGSMAQDLAQYKYEFDTSKDITAKTAIIDLIRSRYSDFDIKGLNDLALRNFLSGVRNGTYNYLQEETTNLGGNK